MTGPLGVPTQGDKPEIKQELTTFIEDGEISKSENPRSDTAPTAMDAKDMNVNAIVNFLRRPVIYKNFDWATADGFGTELLKIHLPADWLSNQMVDEKLSGFRYLKCDLIVKVQVNSQPFNAGRLLMWLSPMEQQLEFAPSSTFHMGGITGYPKVELDLSSDTTMELRVPYYAALTHFDLIRKRGTMGTVRIVVYSPLTGVTDVDATVWIYADNIDLQLPTGVNAQVGLSSEKRRPGNVETISGWLGSAFHAGGKIPMLSAFLSPMGYVADAVAGIASIFGWSKPTDPEFPTKTELGYAKYYCNYNGDSKVKVMALDARNAVEMPTSVFNTNEDEMALCNILKKPTFLQRFTMTKLDAYEKELFRIPVQPSTAAGTEHSYPQSGGEPALKGVVLSHTFLSYLSTMYAFWRGSLKYTFKVVKTPFHSGRVRVFLVPGLGRTGTFQRDKCYSKVFDLRETNEFVIEVPFKYNAPWMAIRPGNAAYTAPTYLVVEVLNALRCPATCADSIEFLVEASAGEDFQFAVPLTRVHDILITGDPGITLVTNAQSSAMLESRKIKDYSPNSIGIGEVALSLRQTMKRYDDMPYQAGIRLEPMGDANWRHTILTSGQIVPQPPSAFNSIAALYRFKSGSMRVASRVVKTTDKPLVHFELQSPLFPFTTLGAANAEAFQFRQLEPFMEMQAPFYQQTPVLLTNIGNPFTQTTDGEFVGEFDRVPHNIGSYINVTDGNGGTVPDSEIKFSRSAGEDFCFGTLIGPPLTFRTGD